ncbi:MAG TPA: ABC transporter ATP-binding protein [Geminicoccaceae bacterium]|nr:ABC transporter ATP-binding protein [Geminicoccaceae bacterium]
MQASLLEVEGLTVEFATPAGSFRATDGVSFSLAAGEVMGLVGESGSGKTVTCRALMRLLPSRQARVIAGSARIDGVDLMALDEAEMMRVRGAKIGMIFQNPMTHLDPVMAIGDQIAEPLRVHQGLPRAAALERAVELLRQVGIPDPARRVRAYPHEFSGGMRQRAMIAAALACRPKLLIADEPTTALDVTVQAQILRLLLELREREGLAIILISHDLGVVAQICDTIAVMYAGRIVERAAKRTLLRRPLHPYTAGLIGSQPGAAPPRLELPSIPGQPPSLIDLPRGCSFHPRCALAEPACRAAPPPLVEVAPGHHTACRRWRALEAAG